MVDKKGTTKVYLGADHGGFAAKEEIKKQLLEQKYEVEDMGAHTLVKSDDYPPYAAAVAKKVSENPKENRGIVLCRSGIGVDIVANKFKGVRSGLVFTEEMAQKAREHDDTNVLAIAADYLSRDRIINIVKIWLETPFSGEERHTRRLKQIEEIEQ